jgi:hypothetical protein
VSLGIPVDEDDVDAMEGPTETDLARKRGFDELKAGIPTSGIASMGRTSARLSLSGEDLRGLALPRNSLGGKAAEKPVNSLPICCFRCAEVREGGAGDADMSLGSAKPETSDKPLDLARALGS